MSAFTDTKARERVVDFVTYSYAGTAWAVRKGNPDGITPDNACGRVVAVQNGTIQAERQISGLPGLVLRCVARIAGGRLRRVWDA